MEEASHQMFTKIKVEVSTEESSTCADDVTQKERKDNELDLKLKDEVLGPSSCNVSTGDTDKATTTQDDAKWLNKVCPECNKTFSSPSKMKRHRRTVHERKRKPTECSFYCEICGKDFSTQDSLKLHHYRWHRPERDNKGLRKGAKIYKCEHEGCNKVFSDSSNYKKHNDAVHLNIRKHLCEKCSFMFKTKGALRSHLNACHEKDISKSHLFECSICSKRFTTNAKLGIHKTVHTNLKPFTCTYEGCGKSFRLKPNLQKHTNLHLNVKPYVCSLCNQGFSRKMYLETHEYKHSGIKMFKCSVCFKRFSQQGNLNIHMKLHGDKYTPHTCDICSKSYTSESSLVRHKLCHRVNVQLLINEESY